MALNDTLLLMMATERHQDMLREAEAERLLQTLKQQPTHWRTKMKQTILYVSFIIGLLALGFVLSVQLTFASVGDPLPLPTAPSYHQGEGYGHKTQGKTADAAKVQQQFEQAWQFADVTLTASRF